MANLERNKRSPRCERLPDERLRVTRIYDIAINTIPNDPAKLLALVWQSWGTEDEEFPTCRLIAQIVSGQDGPFRKPVEEPPQLTRVFEEIPRQDRVMVGDPNISFDQYGNKTVVIEYLQFSDGSTVYADEVGVTPAPTPNEACLLKTLEAPSDGTLIRWKLTFIDSGELSDTETLRFGGKVVLREITSLGTEPATPSGWSLVTTSVEFSQGRKVFRYGFINGGGGGGGAGGEISRDIRYGQSLDQGITTGTTVTTITQISALDVDVNPIVGPVGTQLIDVKFEDDTGFRLWTAVFAKGLGTVDTEVQGREDGSLVYEVTTLSMANATPAYPGTGTGYNVLLTHDKNNGYIVNKATWIQPPPTITFRQQRVFNMPGLAYFVGTDLILQPESQQTLLASIEVSYNTAQLTTTPFSVSTYAGFTETYTPTDTGVAINNQYGLNGYLAAGVTIFGSGDYKGVDCTAYTATKFASDPAALPTGDTVIGVNNDIYLTDVSGTKLFKRTVTTVAL